MRPRYPLNQSPLYRLHRRKGLAELLGLSHVDLESLANANAAEYKCFERLIPREGKEPKRRWIEWPKWRLQRVQRRLARLLDRIEPPEYIHSGFRGRSYLSNARSHSFHVRLTKIDICTFFPSSSAMHVRRCFEETFQSSPDVAAILTKLTTIRGHLPTGSSTSSIISFYAYKPMFDEIHALAVSRGLTMSCCVDDMTFSGEAATSSHLNEVRFIVQRYGLKTHKRHCFEPQQTKVVTGVALTPQGVPLPNIRRRKIHKAFNSFDEETDPHRKVKRGEELLGRVTEAAQIEAQFKPLVPPVAQKLNDSKKVLRQMEMSRRCIS